VLLIIEFGTPFRGQGAGSREQGAGHKAKDI